MRAPSRARRARLSDRLLPYLLMLPAVVLVVAVMAYPMVLSLNMSLRAGRSLDITSLNDRALSFEHYDTILSDPKLWTNLFVSLLYVAGSVLPSMAIGVAIALLVHRRFPGRRILRPLVILPWAVPGVIVSLAFAWILDKSYGIANRILMEWHIVDSPVGWLTDSRLALIGVLMPTIWKTFPLFTIATLAARSAIPDELYEAARVDGARPFAQFRYITLPGISAALWLSGILMTLAAFREFDFIYPLTGGGPNGATETLAVGVYNKAFSFYRFEDAAALGMVTVFISILVVALGARRLRREYF